MASSHLHMKATLLLAQIDAYLDKNPAHFKDSFVLTKGENKTYAVAFKVDIPNGRVITHLDHVCADCAQDVCDLTNHDIMGEAFYRNADTPQCAGCDDHLDFMAGRLMDGRCCHRRQTRASAARQSRNIVSASRQHPS